VAFFQAGQVKCPYPPDSWLQSGALLKTAVAFFLLTNSKILFIYPVYTSTLQKRRAYLDHRIGSFQSGRTGLFGIKRRFKLPDHPDNMRLILPGRERSIIPRNV